MSRSVEQERFELDPERARDMQAVFTAANLCDAYAHDDGQDDSPGVVELLMAARTLRALHARLDAYYDQIRNRPAA